MNNHRQYNIKSGRQTGAVLIIGLLILLIMTVIGVTSLRTATFEERMTGNLRDRSIAFEAAEAALLDAEAFLNEGAWNDANFIAYTAGGGGLYNNAIPNLLAVTGFNWGNDSREVDPAAELGNAITPGRYIIQLYGSFSSGSGSAPVNTVQLGNGNHQGGTPAAGGFLFRITARGTGGTDNAQVILQSTYSVQR